MTKTLASCFKDTNLSELKDKIPKECDLDKLNSHSICFDKNNQVIQGCKCHESCITCSIPDSEKKTPPFRSTNPNTCLSCNNQYEKEGSKLITGKCKKKVLGFTSSQVLSIGIISGILLFLLILLLIIA